MSTADIHPAPSLKPKDEPEDKWQRELRAFRRLLPELLATHRGKYVAIHNEQVVGSGDDIVTVAMDVYWKHGHVPIYVDLVTDEPTKPIRIPSPRISPR